ncbi:major tail protein [Alicyclobacillus dauci]|uniref:Ig-like domain-containing protein n=1 Tax=Alicyclobacillus dauci TaxID=1475485 RepID=A0ABY6Z756_9BACL|nr:major tail protein [Alicyclobacillus dauci]WAH38619.1 Ig-like domain-containing protein [Alicyclobacillus dauci]
MAKVGLRNFHYAVLTQDDSTGVDYGAIKSVPGIVTSKIQPKSNAATLYADDGPSETATVLGEVDVTIELSELPVEDQAAILGHTIDGNGVLVKKSSDQAPYIAVGFISRKSSGKDLYVWLLKGKAQVPEDDLQTQEDKPNFATTSLTLTFVRREYDNAYDARGDEDNSSFTGSATWFDSVYGGSNDTTAPTVTTTPADGASAVADNSTFVWTFSEAIMPGTVTAANFLVMVASDGSLVNGSLALSGDKKTVTFTPAANFTAATEYIAVATTNVKDLAGNALAEDSTTNFTTA